MQSFWILFVISFTGALYVMPHSIRKFRENGYVVKDMYKLDKPMIPTNAGMIVVFSSFISIALLPLIIRFSNFTNFLEELPNDLSDTHMAFLLVVSIYALYGLVDDILDIGRKLKLFFPIAFAYPLISVINPETIWIPLIGNFDLTTVFISDITWSDIFRITIIPVYVMVVSNLVNMHSGFNGLQTGLSVIILIALCLESWLDGKLESILPAGAFLGAMFALLIFNIYPSKVFEGNIGSLLFGSVIGSVIVIQEYWWFGFFILLPHIFNFLLWIIWVIMMKKNPEIYMVEDGKHRKFGFVKENGKLDVPNRLTLKWIPHYYYELNEKQGTQIMYTLSGFFCVVGVLWF